jgi:hypothetical protein
MTEPKRPFTEPTWAVVELMGHTVIAGEVTDQAMFGKSLLRVDHPPTSKRDSFTQYISPDALYRITPTTEKIATEIAERNDPRPAFLYNLEFQLQRMLASGEDKELEYEDVDCEFDESGVPYDEF